MKPNNPTILARELGTRVEAAFAHHFACPLTGKRRPNVTEAALSIFNEEKLGKRIDGSSVSHHR